MKKYLLAVGSLFLVSWAGAGTSARTGTDATDNNLIDFERFEPCRSWSYSRNEMGRLCSFTGLSISVPTERKIRRLEQRILQLEERLQGLEAID